MPFQGLTGFGGGATGLAVGSSTQVAALGDGQTEYTPHYELDQLNYPATDGTPVKRWVIVGTSNDPAVAQAAGNIKEVYVKTHGDGWYWACSHTFGNNFSSATNARPTVTDSEVLIKGGFHAREDHGDQYHVDSPTWTNHTGTMAQSNARNCHLRFQKADNSWYSGSTDSGNFWAFEPDGSDAGGGSNASYFEWWAHSDNEGRLHIYGDISGKVPSSVTHWHEAAGDYGGGSTYGYHAHHNGNNNGSRNSSATHTLRCTLGTLSDTGSHGFVQDGNGNTNKPRSVWMGHE